MLWYAALWSNTSTDSKILLVLLLHEIFTRPSPRSVFLSRCGCVVSVTGSLGPEIHVFGKFAPSFPDLRR